MTDQHTLTSPLLLVDDLTVIRGIGMSRQTWFRQTYGVQTYRDLAALDASDIALRLQAEGKPAFREQIESWLEQATRLAEKGESVDGGRTTSTVDSDDTLLLAEEDVDAPTVLRMQNATQDPDADKESEECQGWDADHGDIDIEVKHVQVIQGARRDNMATHDKARALVEGAHPFLLLADFNVAMRGMTPTAVTFTGYFYLKDLTTGMHQTLGTALIRQTQVDSPAYQSVLENVYLNPGLYRLGVVIQAEEAPALGHNEGLVLLVV